MSIKKVAAYILLVSVYGSAWLVAVLAALIPRRRWKPTGRIAVTGTFFNPNWYLSHITPLARSGVKELILVVDEPQLPIEKVRFVCWPGWVSKLLSRQVARLIWMLAAGIRYRPDLYMGYHLGPGACTALIAGKIMGRPTCYQMTGGPVEIIGGGVDSVDSIGGILGRPSKLIEKMALKVVRQFELVVVRGNKAKEFLAARNIKDTVTIITGSVNGSLQSNQNNRTIHLVFVGRLSPIKQVHQFIEIVSAITHTMPDIRAVVVGDGPLLEDMRKYAQKLGLGKNIEFLGKRKDVETILKNSRFFVLTSKTEGLSIAMAEAMAAGVVPIVADVGELGDLVSNDVNGYLIEPNNIDEYVRKIMTVLQNDSLWAQYSLKAIEAAKKLCGLEVVTGKWQRNIQDVVSRASGHLEKERTN